MLTVASWYEERNWRGKPMRISSTAGRKKGLRKDFNHWGEVPCLIPDRSLVTAYRSRQMSREEYSQAYLRLPESRWGLVSKWLASLKPGVDLTLLCHEREGKFCHRLLVADIVCKQRPDIEVSIH